ncbi:MAG: IPT/TIG domain-containing protein [Thermoanaerobaculia bacterium]
MSVPHTVLALRLSLALLLVSATLAPGFLGAGEFKTGAVQNILRVIPNSNCTDLTTWSNPDLFVDAGGTLRLVAHADRPQSLTQCPAGEWDRAFTATRATPSSPWVTPGYAPPDPNSCPSFVGGYQRCGYTPGIPPNIPPNPGPIGDSAVVKVGPYYYKAFNGGNADFIVGQIYWAISVDGIAWRVYNVNPPGDELWTPLVAPRDHSCWDGAPHPANLGDPIPGGVTETYLAFDASDLSMGPNGTFYIYFGHWRLFSSPEPYLIDSWAVRFAYQPPSVPTPKRGEFGIKSPKEMQIWHNDGSGGTWKQFNSGLMVWSYDGQPGVPGEPVLSVYQGQNGSQAFDGGGGGALAWDPIANNWLHVRAFHLPGTQDVMKSQRATSLAANQWTALESVDMTTVRDHIPLAQDPNSNLDDPFYPGLYYGLDGNGLNGDRTGWWIYTPINHLGCDRTFYGLGIAPAELCTTTAPQLNVISPSSGATTGGESVSISGSGLDCASAVTFGGTSATIVSRAAGLVQVVAPAHTAGAVTVAVATPSGSASRASGFTYIAYGGYHDGIDCNTTFGWAWDSNAPTGRINVNLYDGSTLLGTALANRFRQDLLNAGIGDGFHAFTFSLPPSVRDGNPHTITAKFGGTSTAIPIPRTIQCSGSPSVSIAATDPNAAESPLNTGQFTLTRTGSTSAALTVSLTRSGTATNGSDYSSIATSQTFNVGQSTISVTVTPINDTAVEPPETVVLTVVAGAGYTVGTPANATVTITSEDACIPSTTKLCLVGGRFEVTLNAIAGGNSYMGHAVAYPSSTIAGWFWLFSQQLPEMSVKILDNGNGTYSVTYGTSTDSATTLTVSDLFSGQTQIYDKLAGNFCGESDSSAFLMELPVRFEETTLEPTGSLQAAFTCVPDATTTCLLGGRFQVRVKVGGIPKQAISTTGQSGTYWFTSAAQPEVFVNLVDGFSFNGKYWVYFGSLTNQAYTVEVIDSVSGILKSYSRTTAQPWCGGGDNLAF